MQEVRKERDDMHSELILFEKDKVHPGGFRVEDLGFTVQGFGTEGPASRQREWCESLCGRLRPSEEGRPETVLGTFTRKPRPESGLD